MAKLNYWIAEDLSNGIYSIIAKSKKEILSNPDYSSYSHKAPVKRSICYKDAFDLFNKVTGEGGGRNEAHLI